MKNLCYLLFLFTSINFTYAQDFKRIKLQTKEDFNEAANVAALNAANYILSTPIDKDNHDRMYAFSYLLKWMGGTPDYTFTLSSLKKIRAGEPELTFVHLAGLTKYVFESDSDPNNSDEAMLYAAKTVIQYVQNKENKVKLNAALKKLIAADRNNQLLEYLKKK